MENCVVMEEKDVVNHIKVWREGRDNASPPSPSDVWGSEVQEVVTRRAQEIKKVQEWIA